jgi:hypothetical protein
MAVVVEAAAAAVQHETPVMQGTPEVRQHLQHIIALLLHPAAHTRSV